MGRRAAVLKVGIGGVGAIGGGVIGKLGKGIEGIELVAVADADEGFAAARLAELGSAIPIVPFEQLADLCDVVVEASSVEHFRRIAEPVVRAGKTLIPLSVGGLIAHPDIAVMAAETGARIHVPSGAMAAIDAMRAVSEGEIRSVRLVTRKPPQSLAGSKRMVELGLEARDVTEAVCLFAGDAEEGARLFPANANVAAAIGLAGVGPKRTRLEIWADPAVTCNTHTLSVESDSSDFTMTIQNRFDPATPRTGLITPNSVIATLRGLIATVKFGT